MHVSILKFWEKVMAYISMIVQQNLKFSQDIIHLNYIPSMWNLTTGQQKINSLCPSYGQNTDIAALESSLGCE